MNLPPEREEPKGRPSSSEPAAKRVVGSGAASVSAATSSTVECPICNERYPKTAIEEHAANCGEEVYV